MSSSMSIYVYFLNIQLSYLIPHTTTTLTSHPLSLQEARILQGNIKKEVLSILFLILVPDWVIKCHFILSQCPTKHNLFRGVFQFVFYRILFRWQQSRNWAVYRESGDRSLARLRGEKSDHEPSIECDMTMFPFQPVTGPISADIVSLQHEGRLAH